MVRAGDGAAAAIDFWNADGSEADACGNATRCVARMLMAEGAGPAFDLRTGRGLLRAEDAGGGLTRVNMGPPELGWDEIPLARDVDPDALPLPGAPGAVGMGNPHCVFIVPDAEAVHLASLGPRIEHDPLFPERTNVEFVEVVDRETIRMRVWERGGVRHAGLRLRRLRRGGGRGAPRPDRPPGHRPARRRRPPDRLARRRRLDDRPDDPGLRGPPVRAVPRGAGISAPT